MNMSEKAHEYLEASNFAEYDDEIVECCATYGVVGMSANVHTFIAQYKLRNLTTAKRALFNAAVERLDEVCEAARTSGKSIVVITINNEQELANKALTKAGFIGTPWATRDPERSPYKTKVRVFTKNVYQPRKEK